MKKTHLKSSASSIFCHCLEEEIPLIFGLCRICLHVIVMSFKRKNDVKPSNAMTDIILQLQMTSASAHFQNCELLFDISRFLSINSIGEVC